MISKLSRLAALLWLATVFPPKSAAQRAFPGGGDDSVNKVHERMRLHRNVCDEHPQPEIIDHLCEQQNQNKMLEQTMTKFVEENERNGKVQGTKSAQNDPLLGVAPSNDDASAAISVSYGSEVLCDTTYATNEANEPNTEEELKSVWYQLNVTSPVALQFNFNHSNDNPYGALEPFFGLYRVGELQDFSTFEPVFYKDGFSPPDAHRISLSTPGMFALQVQKPDSYWFIPEIGTLLVQEVIGRPANDDAHDARSLLVGSTIEYDDFNFTNASLEENEPFDILVVLGPDEPTGRERSIWYQFNVTDPVTLAIEIQEASHYPGLGLYLVGDLSDFSTFNTVAISSFKVVEEEEGISISFIRVSLSSPGIYALKIQDTPSFLFNVSGTLSVKEQGFSPSNDNAFQASIVFSNSIVSYDTTNATSEPNEPSSIGWSCFTCGILRPFGPAGRTLWYQYSVTDPVALQVETVPDPAFEEVVIFYLVTDIGDFDTYVRMTVLSTVGQGYDSMAVSISSPGLYAIQVRGIDNSEGKGSLKFQELLPPLNDNAIDALPMSFDDMSNFDTTNATFQIGEPTAGGDPYTKSVWYWFDVVDPVALQIEILEVTDFTEILGLYQVTTGFDNVATFVELGSQSSEQFGSARMAVSLTTPGDYAVQVRGVSNNGGTGSIKIKRLLPPINDDWINTAPISFNSTLEFDTTNATFQPKESRVGFGQMKTVWYRFEVASLNRHRVKIDVTFPSETDNRYVAIYQATNISSFGSYDSLFPRTETTDTGRYIQELCNLDVGTYVIYIQHGQSQAGEGTISLTSQSANDQGDNVVDAVHIYDELPIHFDSLCATTEIDEPSPGPGSGGNPCLQQDGWCSFETEVQGSLWYHFPGSSTSTCVSIEAESDGFLTDNQLALWKVADLSNFDTFEDVAANDNRLDGGFSLDAEIVMACTKANAKYFLQLDYNPGYGRPEGSISLHEHDSLACPQECCPPPTQGELHANCLETKKGDGFFCLNSTEFLAAYSPCGIDRVILGAYSVTLTDTTSMAVESVVVDNNPVGDVDVMVSERRFHSEACEEVGPVLFDEADELLCFRAQTANGHATVYSVGYTAVDGFNRSYDLQRKVTVPRSSSRGSQASSPSSSKGKSSKSSSSSITGICDGQPLQEAEYACKKKGKTPKSPKASASASRTPYLRG